MMPFESKDSRRWAYIDPNDKKHIFVGSAQAVRGLSHTIGTGSTTRLEPGANEAGLYESTDGGKTFTEIWDGNARGGSLPAPAPFGINDVELDLLTDLIARRQLLLKRPDVAKVLSLNVDPRSYWLYTNTPVDNERVTAMFREYGFEEGLDRLAASA